MLHHIIFKSEEIRLSFGASGVAAALEKATSDCTAWLNQHAATINVGRFSTSPSHVFAYVTVWYTMKSGS